MTNLDKANSVILELRVALYQAKLEVLFTRQKADRALRELERLSQPLRRDPSADKIMKDLEDAYPFVRDGREKCWSKIR